MAFDMLPSRDVELFVHQEPASGWLRCPPEEANPEPSKPAGCRDFSLVFVLKGEAEHMVLLGRKKRGLGKGLFNGFGGKHERGETMQECAIRELQEECGLYVAKQHMKARGSLTIARRADEEAAGPIVVTIHLFTAQHWQGAPVETEEMTPTWFSTSDIPYEQMWPEASFYVPALLQSSLNSPTSRRLMVGRVDYSAPSTLAGLWLGWSPELPETNT